MKVDIQTLKAANPILDVVERHGKTELRKVAPGEFAGPCPLCGGKDRFHVNVDRDGWFCRHCTGTPGSTGHWNDAIDLIQQIYRLRGPKEAIMRLAGRVDVTPDDLQAMEARRQKQADERRQAELQAQAEARRTLNERGEWQAYHANLDRLGQRDLWRRRGVSDFWQDILKLGYCPARTWKMGDSAVTSDSLTIPYFRPIRNPNAPIEDPDITWTAIDMKHRLLNTNAPGQKYRHHVSGCGNNLYFSDPFFGESNLADYDLLIVEGEIKAIVTNALLWPDDLPLCPGLLVVGVPGKNWKPEWVEAFRQAKRVFVALDPDANREASALAVSTCKNARAVLLPEKIDDLILAGALDAQTLIETLERVWE